MPASPSSSPAPASAPAAPSLSSPSAMSTDLIPLLDLRFLSQPELNTLALSCPNAYDPRRHLSDDSTAPPKIDKSVFNESAGSRKQTYSRLRLAPHSKSPNPNPNPNPSNSNSSSNTTDKENQQIIFHLRRLFTKEDPSFPLPSPVPISSSTPQTLTLLATPDGKPKKEDDSSKAIAIVEDRDKEVVNSNGETVDLVVLGEKVDPYAEELGKRTSGLKTEVELLGFLNGIEGQWCSRRRRRKFVDASGFGDHLPKGWKLLLGLKRKEGVPWINCRRYVSPNGRHFETCKELSSYVLSLLGHPTPVTPVSNKNNNEGSLAPVPPAGSHKENAETEDMGTQQCTKCNLSFPDRSSYLQHQLSFHQKSRKRRRNGKPLDDSSLMKDGKYICQFCNKSFDERPRYFGHMGAHMRYQGLSLDDYNNNFALKSPDVAQSHPPIENVKDDDNNNDNNNNKPENLQVEYEEVSVDDRQLIDTDPNNVSPCCSPPVTVPKDVREMDCDEGLGSKSEEAIVVSEIKETKPIPGLVSEIKETEQNPGLVSSTTLANANVNENLDATSTKASRTGSETKSLDLNNNNDIEKNNNDFEKNNNDDTEMIGKEGEEVVNNTNNVEFETKESIVSNITSVQSGLMECDVSDYKPEEVNLVISEAKEGDELNSTLVTFSFPETSQACAETRSIDLNNQETEINGFKTQDIFDNSNEIEFETNKSVVVDSTANNQPGLMDCDVTDFGSEEDHDPNLNSNPNRDTFSLPLENASQTCLEVKFFDLNNNTTEKSNSDVLFQTDSFVSNNATPDQTGLTNGPPMSELVENNYTNDLFARTMVENDGLVPLGTSISELKADLASYMNGPSGECAFDINMKDSMLEQWDKPGGTLTGGTDRNFMEMMTMHANLDSFTSLVQSASNIPIPNMIPNKCDVGYQFMSQNNTSLPGFDGLRLASAEPSGYINFTGGSNSMHHHVPVPPPPMVYGYTPDMRQGVGPSLQLGWGMPHPKMFTCVCVWCSREFRHDGVLAEQQQADTLGFMCPSCKDKFSGHLGVLSNSSSI